MALGSPAAWSRWDAAQLVVETATGRTTLDAGKLASVTPQSRAGKLHGEAGRVGRPGRWFATGGRGIHRRERPGQDHLLRHRGAGNPDRPDRRRPLSAGLRGDGLGVVADPRQEGAQRRAGDRQFHRNRLSRGRARRRYRHRRPALLSAARTRHWESSGRRSSA